MPISAFFPTTSAHNIDVFNGDADGICALHQLRLHAPCPQARLVTGVKRDIALLSRLLEERQSRITVLDISLDRNREALTQLLDQGNQVFYADHHYSGNIPVAQALETHIDPSPLVCTSLIIDGLLAGKYRPWAIVGAFGDNIDDVATNLAASLELTDQEIASLREIGRLLNYNGYGMAESDLLFSPAELFREVSRFADPLAMELGSAVLARLRQGYGEDMTRAAALTPCHSSASGRVYCLPEATWAKRVVGVFANQLAREQPDMAHATLIPRVDGSYLVSVRAPLATRQGADALCRRFVTGGGRAAAAGINALPSQQLDDFLAAFTAHFAEPLP
ncbi:MAG: acetyltransferase [Desulfobulbus sp.]|nr:acetyltransferase [Desulfobulbus sp.]